MSHTPLPILDNATPRQLEQAAACNHTELFSRNAIVRGGEVRTLQGLTYTYEGVGFQSMIAFPSLKEMTADEQLDEMMRWYAVRPNRGLGCWSLDPPQPTDLGVKLKARGFQDGWRPCWMALDLWQIQREYQQPERVEIIGDNRQMMTGNAPIIANNVQIMADNEISLTDIKDLPYTGPQGALSPELLHRQPEQAQQFIAWRKGKIVGHCSAFFTTGNYGVAGIYDVAVVPAARGKGIGKALVSAVCQKGREKGYRYAVLNATGRHMYEQIGFQWVGDGFTWWLLP